jgi:PAS domain S-box-containing protein
MNSLLENGIMPYIERAFAGQFAEIPPVLYDPEESIPGITSNAQPKRWTKGVIYPIKNLIGEIQQIVLVHEDITNQILAEEKIKTSEARYRSLLENANDIIYSHDLQGKYLSINSAGEKITGYSQKEILSGMNITQIIVPEHLGLAKKMTERKLSDPDLPTVYEIDIFTKEGRRLTLEVNTRISYEAGKAVAVEGVARDVTGRKSIEREKIQLAEQIEKQRKTSSGNGFKRSRRSLGSLGRAGRRDAAYGFCQRLCRADARLQR